MGNRAFLAVVFVLWTCTMGWLVISKVVPPLRVGDPPSYRSTLSTDESIVCWKLLWNSQPLGWAATKRETNSVGVTEVYNRLLIEELPIDQIAPPWLGALVKQQVGRVDLDARGRLGIDPLGRLSSFDSIVRISDLGDAIRIAGRVEDSQLKFRASVGELSYNKQLALEDRGLVGNEFSPQAALTGLRLGQSWTMCVYSPFRSPNNPLEIVQATVEAQEILEWGDEDGVVPVWVVVYRSDSGAGISAGTSRGRAWVCRDTNSQYEGQVLKQEITVLNSRLTFVRMTSSEASPYTTQLDEDWEAELPAKLKAAKEEPLNDD